MNKLAVNIKNLSKTYADGTKALDDINLEIAEGDFFALLGSNGAGKTTTIGILTDLVDKTEGKVEIYGYDIDKSMNDAKRNIGVVPQEFNFNIFEKVKDIILQQAGYYGISREDASQRADELVEKLGLGDKKNTIAMNLSGGMKRRLMIARALIHKPRLLILDEPTAGVDVELRRGMWEYLIDLNANHGVTILLTTHYLEEVEQLCKNAAIIKDGKIIKNDSVKNLLSASSSQTYIVESKNKLTKLKITDKKIKILDDNTLEIVNNTRTTINKLVLELDSFGVNINSIRPKANRLEELFLDIAAK